MVINVPKTKAMFVSSRNAATKMLENCPDLKLSDEIFQISSNEKHLGVNQVILTIPTRKLFFNACVEPGRVVQSVGHLTHKSEVLGSVPGLATYFRFSFR